MGKDRILLVDRDEDVREMVCRIAESLGFDIVTAARREEALELLGSGPFSVLLAAIGGPETNGYDLIYAARGKSPDLAILCLTAPGMASKFADLINLGASDYIAKPFNAEDMTAKLIRIMRDRNTLLDLTQKMITLKSLHEEQRHLEESKSNFILGVSNELRSPLTVVKETFSLLIDGHVGTLSEDQKEYLGLAGKNILRLTNLINTLFDFSRIESGKELQLRFEPTPVIPLIEESWMALSQTLEERKIPFENHLDPDTPVLLTDRRRVVEVFSNLIGNGLKFPRSDGKIAIDSRGLTENRDFLKIVVTDTGYEIPPEDLPQIFDRFYQGQKVQEGARLIYGLGLAITKEIIDGHGGTIQVESRPGAGTSFVLTLPLFGVNNLFSLLLGPMLNEAERDKVPLSLIQVEFWDQRTKRESHLTEGVLEGVVYAVKMMVRSYDSVLPFRSNRVYVFALVDKKLSKEIGERVQAKLTQGGYIPKGTHVQFKTYSFPKEARTQEDFLKGCRLLMKED